MIEQNDSKQTNLSFKIKTETLTKKMCFKWGHSFWGIYLTFLKTFRFVINVDIREKTDTILSQLARLLTLSQTLRSSKPHRSLYFIVKQFNQLPFLDVFHWHCNLHKQGNLWKLHSYWIANLQSLWEFFMAKPAFVLIGVSLSIFVIFLIKGCHARTRGWIDRGWLARPPGSGNQATKRVWWRSGGEK